MVIGKWDGLGGEELLLRTRPRAPESGDEVDQPKMPPP